VYTVRVSGGKAALMDAGAETNQYIPRVDWLRDSKRVAIQRLNRPQTQLDVLVADAETGKSSVLLTEKDPSQRSKLKKLARRLRSVHQELSEYNKLLQRCLLFINRMAKWP